MEIKNIEKFFLNTLLRISIAGVFLVLVSNVFLFPEDILSITTSSAILAACVLSYIIRHKYPTVAVLVLASVVLAAMIFQRISSPNTTTTIAIILIVGFIFSVMLKGTALWAMHGITLLILDTVFLYNVDGPIAAGITYSTLYFILTYAAWVLKYNYDRVYQDLKDKNAELHEKATEIAARNKELVQIKDNLSVLNRDLEKIVNERTTKIRVQNEILIKYSYTNAHHLRGPVARLLGLGSIYKLEHKPTADFIIDKMVDQANQIDSVIKQINIDLESRNIELLSDLH